MESSRTFRCEICEKTFQTNQKKIHHIRAVHGEVKQQTCNVCNRIFRKKDQLNLHITNYHLEGPRNFKCDYCEKLFTKSRYLENHINTFHEEQRNYNCDSCEKSF